MRRILRWLEEDAAVLDDGRLALGELSLAQKVMNLARTTSKPSLGMNMNVFSLPLRGLLEIRPVRNVTTSWTIPFRSSAPARVDIDVLSASYSGKPRVHMTYTLGEISL